MRIRRHCGGFIESMQTMEIIEPTMEALIEYLSKYLGKIDPSLIEIKTKSTFDERNGWNTHMVLYKGVPYGMVDQIL